MPNRLRNFSLGALALAGASATLLSTAWYAVPYKPTLPSETAKAAEETFQAGGPHCDPSYLDRIPGARGEAVRFSCTKAQEDHRLQVAAVNEQRRASDAAVESLRIALRQERSGYVQTLATVAAFLAALAAALWAGVAAIHTRRSVEIAQKSLELVHRPFLLSDGIWIGNPREALEGGHSFRFKMTNFGSGPAFVRRYWVGVVIDTELPAQPDYPYLWDTNVSVSPGGVFASDDSRPSTINLTEQQREGIISGALRLYVIATVEYDDVGGGHHATRYAFVYRSYQDPRSDTFIPVNAPAYWETS